MYLSASAWFEHKQGTLECNRRVSNENITKSKIEINKTMLLYKNSNIYIYLSLNVEKGNEIMQDR